MLPLPFPLYLFTIHYFYNYLVVSWNFFIHKNCFELFLSVHFLFWEIFNLLNLTFAVCLPFAVFVKLKLSNVNSDDCFFPTWLRFLATGLCVTHTSSINSPADSANCFPEEILMTARDCGIVKSRVQMRMIVAKFLISYNLTITISKWLRLIVK